MSVRDTKSDERKIHDFPAIAGLETLDNYTVVTRFTALLSSERHVRVARSLINKGV
jgi:hypothetical protein